MRTVVSVLCDPTPVSLLLLPVSSEARGLFHWAFLLRPSQIKQAVDVLTKTAKGVQAPASPTHSLEPRAWPFGPHASPDA